MTDREVVHVTEKIQSSELYKRGDKDLKKLMVLPVNKLQQWVRSSFLCDGHGGASMKRLVDTYIKPAVSVSTSSVPDQLAPVIQRLLAILGGEEASEEDAVSIKIACSALNGQLSNHPLIQGLALQASRLVEKRSRGIETMQGRRSKECERETALIADAAMTLSLHAANISLAREFGLAASLCRIHFKQLKEHNLPTPALALNWQSVMDENVLLLDQRFPRAPNGPRSGKSAPAGSCS